MSETKLPYELAAEKMADSGIDYIWISSPANHKYTTGFDNPDGRVLIGKSDTVMFADFRYSKEAALRAYPGVRTVQPKDRLISGELPKILGTGAGLTIGYEENHLICAEFDALRRALPEAEMTPVGNILANLRMVKRADEIELIKKAQKITDDAFSHILGVLSPNMTELEVAAELEYFMKKNGAEDKSFDTIAVSGRNSSSPHKIPENRQLEPGFLTMDFGALVGGYHSDMTRTVVIGKADDEMRKLYNTVLKAQTAALDALLEGAIRSGSQADRIARSIIDDAGYAGTFGHSLGHGVGLEIHEEPGLSSRGGTLAPGNVVTVEPGIYIAGKYGCRIEDMIVITDAGAVDITASPKELIEI